MANERLRHGRPVRNETDLKRPHGRQAPGRRQVFKGFGCGWQRLPDPSWSGAAARTKSFAIMAYDLDAPTGSGWWHWTMSTLPSTASELHRAGSDSKLPEGAVHPLDEKAPPPRSASSSVPVRWIRRVSRSRTSPDPTVAGQMIVTKPQLSRHLRHPLNNQPVSAFI